MSPLWDDTAREVVTNTEEVIASVTQTPAGISAGMCIVEVADINVPSCADWLMVDPVPELTVTLTVTERCICSAPCGGFRCESRVCPTSGSTKFQFCEHCSEYVCDCHIYGHHECGNCKHICDCIACLQLSGLTATETAVAMVERLGTSDGFGSLRAGVESGNVSTLSYSTEEDAPVQQDRATQVNKYVHTSAIKVTDDRGTTRNMDGVEAEKVGTAELLAQGRFNITAVMSVLNGTVDAKDVEDEQYSPETEPGTYSPVTPSCSSHEVEHIRPNKYVHAKQYGLYGWADEYWGTSQLPGSGVSGQPIRSSSRSLAERVVVQLTVRRGMKESSRYDDSMALDMVSSLLEEQVTPIIHTTMSDMFDSNQSFSDVFEMAGMLPRKLAVMMDQEMNDESGAEILGELYSSVWPASRDAAGPGNIEQVVSFV